MCSAAVSCNDCSPSFGRSPSSSHSPCSYASLLPTNASSIHFSPSWTTYLWFMPHYFFHFVVLVYHYNIPLTDGACTTDKNTRTVHLDYSERVMLMIRSCNNIVMSTYAYLVWPVKINIKFSS